MGFCSDWWRSVRDNRGSWSTDEEYTVASCWRSVALPWCLACQPYGSLHTTVHDFFDLSMVNSIYCLMIGVWSYVVWCITLCILLNPTSPAGLVSVPYHYGTDIIAVTEIAFVIWESMSQEDSPYTTGLTMVPFWCCRRVQRVQVGGETGRGKASSSCDRGGGWWHGLRPSSSQHGVHTLEAYRQQSTSRICSLSCPLTTTMKGH